MLAVLILALGIAVNVATFSFVSGIFFRTVPIPNADELVYIYRVQLPDQTTNVTSLEDLEYLEASVSELSGVSAHWGHLARVAVDGEVIESFGEVVLGDFFSLLQVKPALGRTLLLADDDIANPERSIVISYRTWSDRFASDPRVIGKTVRLNDKFFSIVGVMDSTFQGLSDPWRPAEWWVTQTAYSGRDTFAMGIVARLRPQVTLEQVRASVTLHSTRMQKGRFDRTPGRMPSGFVPEPYVVERATHVLTPFDPDAGTVPLKLASAASAISVVVLVLAASNVVGILIVRSVSRSGEFAIRQALGADGHRLGRQLVIESVVLAAAAGGLGVAIGWFLLRLSVSIVELPAELDLAVRWPLVAVTILLSMLVGVGVGLASSLRTAMDVKALEAGRIGLGLGYRRRRMQLGIVAVQVGLSTMIFVLAAVHIRTLRQLEGAGQGYDIDNVAMWYVAEWDPSAPSFQERFSQLVAGDRAARGRQLFSRVYERLRSAGDTTVAVADKLPIYDDRQLTYFVADSATPVGASLGEAAGVTCVSAGFFQALGIRVLRGHDFAVDQSERAGRVAIVSQSLASSLWPNQDPLGRTISAPRRGVKGPETSRYEVIGVVDDVKPINGRGVFHPTVYLPLGEWDVPWGYALALVKAAPERQAQSLKAAILQVSPFTEVTGGPTLQAAVGRMLYTRRFAAGVLAIAAAFGLLLTMAGLYGVISFYVVQRRAEIAVRSALGASRSRIVRFVLLEGARATAWGALPGLAIAVALQRITANFVGVLPTFDGMSLLLVLVAVTCLVLGACYVPARRAVRVEPAALFRSP